MSYPYWVIGRLLPEKLRVGLAGTKSQKAVKNTRHVDLACWHPTYKLREMKSRQLCVVCMFMMRRWLCSEDRRRSALVAVAVGVGCSLFAHVVK